MNTTKKKKKKQNRVIKKFFLNLNDKTRKDEEKL